MGGHITEGRGPLPSCLRYLQACLLLLFFQDVFCFSLGYPFLPQHLEAQGYDSRATALTFTSYGLASITTLVLLLVVQCSPAAATAAPATQYVIILGGAALAVGAGALSTALPSSYAALVVTRVLQGAASALYFVYTLTLVAAVYPLAYHSQAMAFTSAGLTLGDSTGPILGGLVYDKLGVQGAMALQPIAAGVAFLALLGLLVGWRKKARPWNLAPPAAPTALGHQQQQQQQQQRVGCVTDANTWTQQQDHQQQASLPGDLPARHAHHFEPSYASVAKPVLDSQAAAGDRQLGGDQGPCLAAPAACKRTGYMVEKGHESMLGRPSEGQCRLHIPACDPPAVALSNTCTTTAASSRQSPRLPGPRLLLSLLRHPGVVLCCWLALLCQAARTAVDLLVPLVLGASVSPTLVGLLFVGEALGSLLGPFLADARLAAVAKGGSHGAVGVEGSKASHLGSDTTTSHPSGGDHEQGLRTIAAGAGESGRVHEAAGPAATSSSPHTRTYAVARRWLAGSGVVMAVGCFLVLSAWQWLPHTPGAAEQAGSWQALLLIACLLLVMGAGHSACETLIYTLLTHLVAAWPLPGQKVPQGTSTSGEQQGRQQQEALQRASSAAGMAVCADNDSVAEEAAAAAQAQVTQLVMVLYVLFWVAGFSIGAAAAGLPQGLLQQQATCWAMGAALLVSSGPVVCVL
jgi:MFS family permease